MNWLEQVKFEDVRAFAPQLMFIEKSNKNQLTLDDVSNLMVQGGLVIVASAGESASKRKDDRPNKTLWIAVRKEMLEFICGKNPQYDKLRNELSAVKNSSAKIIIPMIAVYIASRIGAEIATITGFVSLIIGFLLKTGTVGFCNYYYKSED